MKDRISNLPSDTGDFAGRVEMTRQFSERA
jgi:hypothetical protein